MNLRIIFCLSVLFITTHLLGQKADSLLFNAYTQNSSFKLNKFFKNWLRETNLVRKKEFSQLTDTLQTVYEIYKSFYNPKNPKQIIGSEWGNKIYKESQYLLTQENICFGIVETLDKNLIIEKWLDTIYLHDSANRLLYLSIYKSSPLLFDRKIFKWPIAAHYDTVFNFRPEINKMKAKPVTLTKKYDNLLSSFLGDNHSELGEANIMSPAKSKSESDKRKKFLEKYIKIWYGHWGEGWNLLSYPFVNKITIDKKLETAIIDYQMIYEGGYAYMKKVGGNWRIIKAERTWIQ